MDSSTGTCRDVRYLKEAAHGNGVSPAANVQWLELADERALATLICENWNNLFAYRIKDRDAFFNVLATVKKMRRQVAMMPSEMIRFDVMRLQISANEILKALRPTLVCTNHR